MKTKTIARGSLILLAAIFVAGQDASAQTSQQNVTVTVRPAQTVEERVADEFKEKALRKAAEEKLATEESARLAERSPKALLSRARTVFIESNTSFFNAVQLQDTLRKRDELETWQMAIVDGWDKRNVADMLVEIDRPLFTYTFTYKLTDRSTGIILASGKVTAFDSNGAAPKLASKIIDEIKKARGETQTKEAQTKKK